MIYIEREKDTLDNLEKTKAQFNFLIRNMTVADAYKFYNANKNKYQYNTPETKKEFFKMSGGRCSFCTKRISDFNSEMTVEHIETKSSTPLKIFEWKNLLCSCKTCNTKRSTNAYNANLYLDPTKIKDIDRYFEFNADGTIEIAEGLSVEERKKADYMIKMYKLDRSDLNTDRREFFKHLMEDDGYYSILKKDDKASMRIIFLSVFTYYKRRIEKYE